MPSIETFPPGCKQLLSRLIPRVDGPFGRILSLHPSPHLSPYIPLRFFSHMQTSLYRCGSVTFSDARMSPRIGTTEVAAEVP